MLIKLIRWILGYVKFNLKGEFPEKFVSFLLKEGISIWDIRKLRDGISGKAFATDYKKLRFISKKCCCKIHLEKKYGVPFNTKKYRRRKGLGIGVLLFFVIIYFLSSYVWSINVTGNSEIPTEDIVNTIKDLGISAGSLKKRIDIPIVQQEAMIRLPNVAWMSINLKGSYADISIKEKVIAPNIVTEDKPCSIKALTDGQIERIETYKGTPFVKEGDAVLKGQILISGVMENDAGENSFVHSEGKVYAYTRRNLQETVPFYRVQAVDTGKVIKRFRLKFFGLELPFSLWYKKDDSYRCEFRTNFLKVGNIPLPIILYKEEWYEQVCNEVQLTYEEALKEANKKIQEREKSELKDKKILNKCSEDREENDTCVLSVSYNCLEDIGQKEEIIMD